METVLSSYSRKVVIGPDLPTVLIGERINPTGKRKMAEALRAGALELVRKEAASQAQADADVVDINVGTAGVDEINLLPQAVQVAMDTIDLPLCLDSANPLALEAALKVYRGKALVNSVSGKEESLAKVLPLVKQYGAAVVGLVQDDEGIPAEPERRLDIAHKIVERAEAIGIPHEDIVIDCLALAIGAEPKSGLLVIETIRRVKEELGVNLVLGASNISFGMPEREVLNSALVAIAIAAGATCLIADVAKIRPIVLAVDLILGRDRYGRRYIEGYRQRQRAKQGST
jgi:5-methyltetrahydrofolate--homocysteine methyltransferase